MPVTSANDRTAVVETGTGPGATTELREYVYGPGDVDELTAVVDGTAPSRHVHYVLADGNANVMGLTTPAGDVVVQQQYTPYGEVAARDALVPEGQLPRCRAGHQGLFFYRCDGQPTDPALAPAAAGLYYNRNRWYSPQLGRPTTRDPNESALPLLIALAMQGDALDLVLGAFDAAGQFADGANLYGYLGANPINRRDPSGLSWEDDADFDDLISDLEGHRLYALGARNEGARWASLGLNTALSIASSLLGLDVFESVYLLSTGRGGFWDAMNIVASVNPAARIGKAGQVIGKGFAWAQKGARTARVTGKAAEHLFKVLPYGQAKKLTKGFNHQIEAHKLLEWRHMKGTGVSLDDLPAVILPRETHKQITRELMSRLPQSLPDGRLHEALPVYIEVYTRHGHPEWVRAIERYFR